jgi:hypothetical protein
LADPKDRRRQRDRERYALNREDILKRQRMSREEKKTNTDLLNHEDSVSHTPGTGLSAATQLQKKFHSRSSNTIKYMFYSLILLESCTDMISIAFFHVYQIYIPDSSLSQQGIHHDKENNVTYDDESN